VVYPDPKGMAPVPRDWVGEELSVRSPEQKWREMAAPFVLTPGDLPKVKRIVVPR
jgi:hypothetical protein